MENLNKHIEHTLLKQDAKLEDFTKLFNEAKEHQFLGVCINPAYVKLAKENFTTMDSIMKVNGMEDENIKPGDRLLIIKSCQ